MHATHVFQKKMLASSGTFTQVASNNGGGNQSPPPINVGTSPDPVDSLHHMGTDVIYYKYVFQTNYACEHHKNSVSDPELSLLIDDLHKAWNLKPGGHSLQYWF